MEKTLLDILPHNWLGWFHISSDLHALYKVSKVIQAMSSESKWVLPLKSMFKFINSFKIEGETMQRKRDFWPINEIFQKVFICLY